MDKSSSRSITVDLGGVAVRFDAQTGVCLSVSKRFADFTTPQPAETLLSVHRGNNFSSLGGQLSFKAGFWSFQHSGENEIFRMEASDPALVLKKYYVAVLSSNRGRGELYFINEGLTSAQDITEVEVPPWYLDQLLAAQLISGLGGLHFHACGIKTPGGKGIMFAGVSGSGKSTTAHLWQQAGAATLLSDERVAVRKLDGQYRLFGTAWHGDGQTSTPDSAPLEQILILRHADSNKVRPLKPAEAVAALVVRSYQTLWDSKGMERALEFLDELIQSVPCFEFGFVPDQSAVDFVKCLNDL